MARTVVGRRPQDGELPTLPASAREEREDFARRNIAYIVVAAYVFFLLISAAPPVVFFLRSEDLQLADVRELTTALAIGVSSLSGVLGFVLGYYFKASEGDDK